MAVSWEIDLYYSVEGRTDADAEADGLEEDTFHGRPVYRQHVECDAYEHGTSGSIALYYKDDDNMMSRSVSIKDPGLVGVDAYRIGEPDEPEAPETEEEGDGEWAQEAS